MAQQSLFFFLRYTISWRILKVLNHLTFQNLVSFVRVDSVPMERIVSADPSPLYHSGLLYTAALVRARGPRFSRGDLLHCSITAT